MGRQFLAACSTDHYAMYRDWFFSIFPTVGVGKKIMPTVDILAKKSHCDRDIFCVQGAGACRWLFDGMSIAFESSFEGSWSSFFMQESWSI
jgi:hypothetical protein